MHEDVERIIYNESEIAAKVRELGEKITEDYAGKDLLVVGILKGASIFVSDLIRKIDLPLELDYMSVSSYGSGASTSGTVKIKKDVGTDISGRNVLICEDIIDSGLTMSHLIELLKERNPASLSVCALLSKPSRRETEVEISYCGWEVPDEFLIGYGLDYAEMYRGLPYIGILKRTVYEK